MVIYLKLQDLTYKTVYLIDSNIVTSATSNADIPPHPNGLGPNWSQEDPGV